MFNLQYIKMRAEKALLPKHRRILAGLGENIRLARLRRKLSAAKVAERAGISRNTLYMLEKGGSNTSITTLFQVLVVLGLESDFSKLASDDELGRRLEDANLKAPRSRAPKTKKSDKNRVSK
ncbi:MAG: helix-turn-helix transcriptional regulator [Planctomycetota bacterium]